MKGLKGNKRRGTHTTAIGLAEKLIKEIQHCEGFEGVRFGEIKTGSRSNGERRLKVSPSFAGLELQLKEGSAVQHLTIFTKKPEKMIEMLGVVCRGLSVIVKVIVKNVDSAMVK